MVKMIDMLAAPVFLACEALDALWRERPRAAAALSAALVVAALLLTGCVEGASL
uniref:hypothetical protein n=1 Tax=Collinsella sp. BA40 TaxID=2560852 RepID=UPI00164F490D|nr:hypothetical protein [Collinsella sp. BA40]